LETFIEKLRKQRKAYLDKFRKADEDPDAIA